MTALSMRITEEHINNGVQCSTRFRRWKLGEWKYRPSTRHSLRSMKTVTKAEAAFVIRCYKAKPRTLRQIHSDCKAAGEELNHPLVVKNRVLRLRRMGIRIPSILDTDKGVEV